MSDLVGNPEGQFSRVTAHLLQEEGRVPVALPCLIEKTEFSILDKAEDKANWRLKILSRNVDNFIDKVGKAISENGGMVHVLGLQLSNLGRKASTQTNKPK